MLQSPEEEQRAKNRWTVIQAMRIMGVILVLLGILMTQGAIDLLGELNEMVGGIFVVIGLLDGFLMPIVLARKWRSPDR